MGMLGGSWGGSSKERLKEEYIDNSSMVGCGSSEDYENFCNKLDVLEEQEVDLSDKSIYDVHQMEIKKGIL